MKKRILTLVLIFVIGISLAFADSAADKVVYTDFGLSYGSIVSPSQLENNTSGELDTAVFDAKAGLSFLCRWLDVYAGASFNFYVDRQNFQNYYTFYPVYGGIKVNIMPEMCVYPDIFFEYGKSISDRHTQTTNPYTGATVDHDQSYLGGYYNLGLGVNWNVTDISVLSFRIERPSFEDQDGNEIHAIKTGLAWKIYY
jgi:hypothetical protein